jgi:hypothetical protein
MIFLVLQPCCYVFERRAILEWMLNPTDVRSAPACCQFPRELRLSVGRFPWCRSRWE